MHLNGVFIIDRTDIIQIGAASGLEEMFIYMRPTTQISLDATAATGLTFIDGVLKCKGQVTTVPPKNGLCNFLDFRKKNSKSHSDWPKYDISM